jgi:hypothetical protein
VPKLARSRDRACALLARAASAPTDRLMTRRARQAVRALARVLQRVGLVTTDMAWPCTQALTAGLDEARARASAPESYVHPHSP